MDAGQLEEYKKRMQDRYHAQKQGAARTQPQVAASEAPPRDEAQPKLASDEDERLARQLQEEDQRQADEELARRLQSENSPPTSDVRPPANIQRVERLINPLPAPSSAPVDRRPLLPRTDRREDGNRDGRDSCWPESERSCGFSDQFLVLSAAGWLTAGIIGVFLWLYLK